MMRWAEMAIQQGWTVAYTGKSHLKWRAPNGAVTFSPSTPSAGKRSLQNLRATLRRLGLRGI